MPGARMGVLRGYSGKGNGDFSGDDGDLRP